MKKIGIFMLLIVLLTSCTINSKDFEFVSEEGSFLMDKTGVIKKDTDLSNKLILTYYLEPTSYTSIKMLSDTYEAIENLRSHDEVIIRMVPLMYLNDRYENDLSAELASLLLTLAEYDQDNILDYLLKLQDKDFILENTTKDIVAENFQDEAFLKHKEAMLKPLVSATQIYLNQNEQPIIRLTYNDEHIDVEYTRFDQEGKKLVKTIQEFDKLDKKELINLFPDILEKEKNS